MKLQGVLKLDEKEQKIEGTSIGLRISGAEDGARADPVMGTQINVSIAVTDGKLVIKTTVTPQGGQPTTTTTTTDISTPK